MQFVRAIQKVATPNPSRKIAKWRKISTESTVTGPKYVRIQFFLDIPTAYEQGQI